jgi:nitronate monooxygenase
MSQDAQREQARGRLLAGTKAPVIAAPMFLVSGAELVSACCRAGVIGSFPTINARSPEILDEWLGALTRVTRDASRAAPFAANLIVHRSNTRLDADFELVRKHEVPIVIASVGSPASIVDGVHRYGGLVLADVATLRHARRALEAGVDGLILLTAGCGGNTGWLNPFAFVAAVREFYDGPLVLAGSITDGRQIGALGMLGVDLAYVGTPFIVAEESMARADYREMLIAATADDIFLTDAITGIPANMLRPSLERAGFDVTKRHEKGSFSLDRETRAWKDVWSAGHGVGAVRAVEPAAAIVERLRAEYAAAAR